VLFLSLELCGCDNKKQDIVIVTPDGFSGTIVVSNDASGQPANQAAGSVEFTLSDSTGVIKTPDAYMFENWHRLYGRTSSGQIIAGIGMDIKDSDTIIRSGPSDSRGNIYIYLGRNDGYDSWRQRLFSK